MFRRKEKNISLRKSREKMKYIKQESKRLGNRYVSFRLLNYGIIELWQWFNVGKTKEWVRPMKSLYIQTMCNAHTGIKMAQHFMFSSIHILTSQLISIQ